MPRPPKLAWRESSADWPAVPAAAPAAPHSPRAVHRSLPDVEILAPPHGCPSRRAGLIPATFNLVATIVGGGILSVPLAFEKCGIVLATVLLVFSAVTTDFSLYILCSCSRRTGASSYVEVCRLSYGPGLELFTTVLLFVFLIFVIVAYMVLIKDIFTPVAMLAVGSLMGSTPESSKTISEDFFGNVVLLGIVILVGPFLLKRNLHSLRFNCYLGFASISVLCLAIAYRALQKYCRGDIRVKNDASNTVRWLPESFADVLFAFPIITLSFMCHFNMISIHGSLIDPTRKRIRQVIDNAMGASAVLTYCFGLFGYLYAGADTFGNILLNFDFNDKLVLVGRLGCGITLMLAMAMIALPCRESLLALGPQFREWRMEGSDKEERHVYSIKEEDRIPAGYGSMHPLHEQAVTGESMGEEEMIPIENERGGRQNNCQAKTNDEEIAQNLHQSGTDTPEESHLFLSDGTSEGVVEDSAEGHGRLIHFGSTFAIISICYIGAVAAPGVAIVWSICGSCMAFLIAFILPSICYIKARAVRKGHTNKRVFASWLLLLFSIAGAAACTVQTIWRLFYMQH